MTTQFKAPRPQDNRIGSTAFRLAEGVRNFENGADARALFLAELRATGSTARALSASGLEGWQLHSWQKRDSSFARRVAIAQQFARSDEVDFGKWVTR